MWQWSGFENVGILFPNCFFFCSAAHGCPLILSPSDDPVFEFFLFCLYSLVWRQSWFWFTWLCSAVTFVVVAYRFGYRVFPVFHVSCPVSLVSVCVSPVSRLCSLCLPRQSCLSVKSMSLCVRCVLFVSIISFASLCLVMSDCSQLFPILTLSCLCTLVLSLPHVSCVSSVLPCSSVLSNQVSFSQEFLSPALCFFVSLVFIYLVFSLYFPAAAFS